MSREPSSAAHRWGQTHGGHKGYFPEQKPEPSTQPPRGPQRKRNFRIVVEPAKPKPPVPQPTRGYHDVRREEVVSKWTTTTEALTAEERQIISGYRLSVGGEAADAERRRIEKEVGRR